MLAVGQSAVAYDFKVGKIYYNITDETKKTVEITYEYTGTYGANSYYGGVVIPESVSYNDNIYSVTSIGSHAFSASSALTSITIPNSVTSIGQSAFKGCSGLTSVTIPNSVKTIGDRLFADCAGLTEINVESGNSVYDSRDNCNAIIETSTNTLIEGCKSTIIPNSITCIGDYAFYCRSGLKSITIPNSVTSIGGGAFMYCAGLTSITIPNSVTSIGQSAFSGCTGLISITIPNSVKTIGDRSFAYCAGLTEIKVESGNSVYDSRDNCNAVIETSTNTLITGCKNTIIPNSVTEIGDYALKECTSLTTIIISNSVTLICRDAFDGCTGLTEVISLNPTPPACSSSSVFDSGIYSTAKLSVPESSVSAYKSAEVWQKFYNIEAGINDVVVDEIVATEVARYDIDGRLLSKPTPGINIIKMSDGSTRKEWVKE